MNDKKPPETPGLDTDGMLPVQFFVSKPDEVVAAGMDGRTECMFPLQYFVSEGTNLPPGTPARPRPNRPPYNESTAPPTTEQPEDKPIE